MSEPDFRSYYSLEKYLFGSVTDRFNRDGYLNAFDFFCIVIWKANRAKSKVAAKILAAGYDDLETGVHNLSRQIFKAPEAKEKLRVLIEDWAFRLPMASAILTVLYPHLFSVYDIRVCDSLKSFHKLQNISNFDRLWREYQFYLKEVSNTAPENLSLRDKDRWLWGRSFYNQLNQDIESDFLTGGQRTSRQFDRPSHREPQVTTSSLVNRQRSKLKRLRTPSFQQVYDCLRRFGSASVESTRGTKYTIEARPVKGNPAILAYPRRGRIAIHEDCWGYDITCQGTRAGGVYNGPYSIYDWYIDHCEGSD